MSAEGARDEVADGVEDVIGAARIRGRSILLATAHSNRVVNSLPPFSLPEPVART